MAQVFQTDSLNTLYAELNQRYALYITGTEYLLTSLIDYQALPAVTRPLYVVTDKVLKAAYTITSSQEKFVSLTKLSAARKLNFMIASGSTPTGSHAGSDLWLRTEAAERLCQAAVALQSHHPDYSFWITDAYRPLRLQRQHFNLIQSQLATQGFTGDELYHRTVELIADPDTLPPHSTGGTVDITIYSRKTNAPINMGTVVDATELPLIHTWCPLATPEQRHHRMLLCTVLTAAGFKNTPLEWWHYSYGDLEWALHGGLTATVYDSVEDLDESLIKP